MRTLLLFLALLHFPAQAKQTWDSWIAQHTQIITSTDDAALAGFGAAIKDAQIVMLDEQTHGEENVFALKARLVRYLHEQHDYDVLIMESGLYDLAKMWESGQPIKAQAPGNLFYLYAQSPSVQELLAYIDEHRYQPHPLILSGMDSQHTGAYAQKQMMADLETHLRQTAPDLVQHTDWQNFVQVNQQLLLMNRNPPTPVAQAAYFTHLTRLQKHFARNEAKDNPFWPRILASLDNQARRYWDLIPDQRSAAMGENLLALLKHTYPNKKVIVWGHFVHLNRSGLPEGGNLGSLIAKAYGKRAYVVHFTSNNGNYYNFNTDQVTPILRMATNAIENRLEQRGALNFSDWRKLPPELRKDNKIQAALVNYLPNGFYDYNLGAIWQERIDGSFYLGSIK